MINRLSISSHGHINYNNEWVVRDQLPPLLSIRADYVYNLQWYYTHLTIWLMDEHIHVRNQKHEYRCHWSDDAQLKIYCNMKPENLLALADYLNEIPRDAFDMGDFCRDEHGEQLDLNVHDCGTIGCAVGFGPQAGLPVTKADENNWLLYAHRVFGIGTLDKAWAWCFAGAWAARDNTPTGAAKRIRHLIYHGLPHDAEQQLGGFAPYIFEQEVA